MPQLLLDWLTQRFPTAKRQNLKRMVEEGRVSVNGRPARKLKETLQDASDVRIVGRASPAPAGVGPLTIVHEDEDLLVVHKPAGLLTSTIPREKRPTAAAILKRYLESREPQARLGVIHRLDREAEGLLVFSKNDAAYESLKRQFFRHTVTRVYMALVWGKPTPRSGRIESKLVELPDGSVKPTTRPGRGQIAISEYDTVAESGKLSLLRVKLHTGRKHQIRAHLKQRAVAIVGDAMYGGQPLGTGRLMLAAVLLEFDHPRTGKRTTFEHPLPAEMANAVRQKGV